ECSATERHPTRATWTSNPPPPSERTTARPAPAVVSRTRTRRFMSVQETPMREAPITERDISRSGADGAPAAPRGRRRTLRTRAPPRPEPSPGPVREPGEHAGAGAQLRTLFDADVAAEMRVGMERDEILHDVVVRYLAVHVDRHETADGDIDGDDRPGSDVAA